MAIVVMSIICRISLVCVILSMRLRALHAELPVGAFHWRGKVFGTVKFNSDDFEMDGTSENGVLEGTTQLHH